MAVSPEKIIVAESAGFCFGVKRSVEIAEKTVTEYGHCASFGPLIHNGDVIAWLNNIGATRETLADLRQRFNIW